jgi:hypothetical protein
MSGLSDSAEVAARRSSVAAQALGARRVSGRLHETAGAVLALVALVLAVPGLEKLRTHLSHAAPGGVAGGVALELLSALSYVVIFRSVFCARMSWRLSYRIGLSEHAANSLLSASGAGDWPSACGRFADSEGATSARPPHSRVLLSRQHGKRRWRDPVRRALPARDPRPQSQPRANLGGDGARLRALIVPLWRAGLRIREALELAETDLDAARGAVIVRRGKGGRRREAAWTAGRGVSSGPGARSDRRAATAARSPAAQTGTAADYVGRLVM